MTDDTDLKMFMVKLKRLLSIGNIPFIEARKSEIQLLGYLIGSCFKDMTIEEKQLHDVGNWKRRLIQAAQDAEDAVDMLVSSAIIKYSFLDDDPETPRHQAEDSVDMSVSSDIIKIDNVDSLLDDDSETPRHQAEDSVDMSVSSDIIKIASVPRDRRFCLYDFDLESQFLESLSDVDYETAPSFSDVAYKTAPNFSDVAYKKAPSISDVDYRTAPSFSDVDYETAPSFSTPDLQFQFIRSLSDVNYETPHHQIIRSLSDDSETAPSISDFEFENPRQIFIDNMVDCSPKILKGVMDDLKSMREEMRNETGNLVKQEMMMLIDNKFESTGGDFSPTEHEELIVGFGEHARSIIDRLTGYQKKLDIFSIVGMGGLGKTTLATKIFNDPSVKYRFDIRGWITVSQSYSKRDMLLQLLVSIGESVDKPVSESVDKPVSESVDKPVSESKLYEMLYKSLKGKRYLIVIDDIWSSEAWNEVRICFPDDNTGSRVLVTTRLTEVACHISGGRSEFTHNLGHLTEDQSWDLLCRKTFRGNDCPENLTETGKHIAKKCGGLPLALVVIAAGLLEKGEKRKDVWENIAKSVGSYIINDPKGCLDTLALSYDHLPSHLKKCFLYVGGFPEDYKIQTRKLIRLWMAEGFIKEAGQRSLEEEAEYYFMDLIDRNLLIVADKRSNGGIKSCRIHDILRELCLKKADEESFFKKISMQLSDNNPFSDSTSNIVKQRRLFINYEVLWKIHSHNYSTHTRSVLCFYNNRKFELNTIRWVHSFLLLGVLDLLSVRLFSISETIMLRMLVHLRYLAVCIEPGMSVDRNLSSRIKTDFGSLQTLIVVGQFRWFIYIPDDFGMMVNLRHLQSSEQIDFPRDFGGYKLFNLQTLSRLRLHDSAEILHEYFPNIKKLGCSITSDLSNDGILSFALLSHLEALRIEIGRGYRFDPLLSIRFPEALKKLTLKGLNHIL